MGPGKLLHCHLPICHALKAESRFSSVRESWFQAASGIDGGTHLLCWILETGTQKLVVVITAYVAAYRVNGEHAMMSLSAC